MKRLHHLLLPAIAALFSLVSTLHAFVMRVPPHYRQRVTARPPTTCHASTSSSSNSVVDRLDLRDNFNRWRFMQNLLDGEIEASDANELLYAVLDSFLKFPPNNDSSQVVSPQSTSNVCDVIQELLTYNDKNNIPAFDDPNCSPGDAHVLQKLELLLPDERENEDAFKGSWDTVLDLHGREAVKINESRATPEWNALCTVARVLIYFDFMTRGVPQADQ